MQAVSGGQELTVNPVTLAEVLVQPTREGGLEQVLAELGNLCWRFRSRPVRRRRWPGCGSPA
ncbi:hypothetical protein ACVBEQ_12160 [Nakamurella sp. GG22]